MKRVLFVCVHNSGRSKMAEAFFNQYAHGEAVAESAGTEPSDCVNPTVVAVMKEFGFDLSASLPRLLTSEMTKGIEKAITMGCMDNACPVIAAPKEDWSLVDPKGKDMETVRKIRDAIRLRVLALISELGITPAQS